jgi:hypothetical protein
LVLALCLGAAFHLDSRSRTQTRLFRTLQVPNFESLALKHQMARAAEAEELKVEQARKEMEQEAFKQLTMQTLHPRLVKELVRATAKEHNGTVPRHSLASQAQSLLTRQYKEVRQQQDEARRKRSEDFSQYRHTLHTFLTRFLPQAYNDTFVELEVRPPAPYSPSYLASNSSDGVQSRRRRAAGTRRQKVGESNNDDVFEEVEEDEDKQIHRRFPLPEVRRIDPFKSPEVDPPTPPSPGPISGPDFELIRRVNDHVLAVKLATLAIPWPPPVAEVDEKAAKGSKSFTKYVRPKYGYTLREEVEEAEPQLVKQQLREIRKAEQERVKQERLQGMHPKPAKYLPEPHFANGTVATRDRPPEDTPYRYLPVQFRGVRH